MKTDRTSVAICLCCMVAACQHAPEARIETVTVQVPVAVQPIKPADVPTPPPPLGPRPASASQAADAAFAGYCSAIAYVIRAVPLLAVSAGLPPVQAPDYKECAKN